MNSTLNRKKSMSSAAESISSVRLASLVPRTKSGHDANPGILLLGAGILLALVLASGSLVAVATRVVKGQAR